MNVERMLYLADQLENPTDPKLKNIRFNMRDFSGGHAETRLAIICGTAACIGGHACILFGAEFMSCGSSAWALDLTLAQAQKLFYNSWNYVSDKPLPQITTEEAVAAIRRMVKEHVDETLAQIEPQVVEEVPVAVL